MNRNPPPTLRRDAHGQHRFLANSVEKQTVTGYAEGAAERVVIALECKGICREASQTIFPEGHEEVGLTRSEDSIGEVEVKGKRASADDLELAGHRNRLGSGNSVEGERDTGIGIPEEIARNIDAVNGPVCGDGAVIESYTAVAQGLGGAHEQGTAIYDRSAGVSVCAGESEGSCATLDNLSSAADGSAVGCRSTAIVDDGGVVDERGADDLARNTAVADLKNSASYDGCPLVVVIRSENESACTGLGQAVALPVVKYDAVIGERFCQDGNRTISERKASTLAKRRSLVPLKVKLAFQS